MCARQACWVIDSIMPGRGRRPSVIGRCTGILSLRLATLIRQFEDLVSVGRPGEHSGKAAGIQAAGEWTSAPAATSWEWDPSPNRHRQKPGAQQRLWFRGWARGQHVFQVKTKSKASDRNTPFTRYNRLSNRFDNRLYRVNWA